MLTLRPYQPTDRAACLQLFDSNTPLYFDPAEKADFETWLTGSDTDKLAYQTTEVEAYFVAEHEGKVVACGGYYIAKNEARANLVWGMVHRDFHKRQIGCQLLSYRLQNITQHHPQVSVSLDTTQHSFPFFQKHGFEVTKVQKDFYAPGLDRYDMMLQPKTR